MKAIVLAAGYGRRMRPLSDTTHKTLLPIGESTLLGRLLDSLEANGIHEVVLVTGYRHQEVRAYAEEHSSRLRFQFVHNARFAETNNIHSLALALEKVEVDDSILLIESDLVFQPKVIGRLIHSRFDNVALVDRYSGGMDGTVVTVDDHVITSIIPPHLQDTSFDFSDKFKTLNLYKFSRQFCNTAFKKLLTFYSQALDANCFYEVILGILIYVQKEVIHAEILDGEQWVEVDVPNDLMRARSAFDADFRFDSLERDFGGLWNHRVLDFCYLRNLHFPTRSFWSELKSRMTEVLTSYGTSAPSLNQKMAHFLLCRPERVVALNGATQAYPLLGEKLRDRPVRIPWPTFGEYPRSFPAALRYADSELESWCSGGGDFAPGEVVVVVNPNNPSGAFVPPEQLHGLAASHPEVTWVVDESFVDFAGAASLQERLEAAPLGNVMVLKSLSKLLGMPGLRLGLLYSCHGESLSWFSERLPIWNVNSLAEFVLELLPKHREALARSFELSRQDRADLISRLLLTEGLGEIRSSQANFVLVRSRQPAPGLARDLVARHGLYLKDVSFKFGQHTWLRIAARLPEENARLATALQAALTASGVEVAG